MSKYKLKRKIVGHKEETVTKPRERKGVSANSLPAELRLFFEYINNNRPAVWYSYEYMKGVYKVLDNLDTAPDIRKILRDRYGEAVFGHLNVLNEIGD